MRVVAWNMAHRVGSWRTLEALEADVALLTEARLPGRGLRGNAIGGLQTEGRDRYRRPWAAAVISRHELVVIHDARTTRHGRLVKVPFECSRPGTWVASVVSVPEIGMVTAVALYGLMDERSDASVHRSLSELAPVFDDPLYKERLVLGGDLNTWTGWEAGSAHLARDRVVLDRIREYGLVDCLEATRKVGRLADCPCSLGDGCTHTRTRLDRRWPDVPYQMDYLFASPAMTERLTSCEARELPDSPSDHFPIVAEFEL